MYEHKLLTFFNNVKKYVLKGSEKSTSLNLSALNLSKKPLWDQVPGVAFLLC